MCWSTDGHRNKWYSIKNHFIVCNCRYVTRKVLFIITSIYTFAQRLVLTHMKLTKNGENVTPFFYPYVVCGKQFDEFRLNLALGSMLKVVIIIAQVKYKPYLTQISLYQIPPKRQMHKQLLNIKSTFFMAYSFHYKLFHMVKISVKKENNSCDYEMSHLCY